MIFSTVFGPQEPALTVGSLAIRQTGRPAIVAMPVTTPSAPKPSCSQLASRPSSVNESGSTSRATRSRTGSLPCPSDFSWWPDGPPARACSSACLRSGMGGLSPLAAEGGLGAQPRVLHRRLTRVVVEALARLAAVPAGGEHLPQGGRLGEATLAELVEHDLADRPHRVEADEVSQRERPHRMPRPGLHGLVDLGHRAYALLEGADRVEHVGHEQPVDDEPGLVLGRDPELADAVGERRAHVERLVGGGHGADDLDQLHYLRRVEEVEPEEAVRVL